jgi:hypothetical protein
MRKLLLCSILSVLVTSSFGMMDTCRFATVVGCLDSGCGFNNYVYATSNGNCCSPTAGAAYTYYSWDYFGGGGIESNQTVYMSAQQAASLNPYCA